MPSALRQSGLRSTPANQRGQDRALSVSIQADLAALRAAIVAITAKLDLDATVTGTDYASTTNPAALGTTT